MTQARSMLRRWLRPLLPAVRPMRRIPGILRSQVAVSQMRLAEEGTAVCYLTRRFPGQPATRAQHTYGGAVKMTYLAEAFPHLFPTYSILYVVSSVSCPQRLTIVSSARRKGVKIVLNQNGVAYSGWHGPGWERTNWPMAEILRMADYVLYQSQFCKLSADRFLGEPQAGWEILCNPVDTNLFTPAQADPDPQRLVLLLGGNQGRRYRFEMAVRTLALVARQRPDVRLLVTGRLWPPDQAEAKRLARALMNDLGVAGKVEFTGLYSQRESSAIMRRAHILLHTQYNDSCPTVVLEAMACGLPVVYLASGGVHELVGAEAGVGVPTELSWERILLPDPSKLADAVLKVAERRTEYAEAARQRVVERFSLETYIARHRELFAQLLSV